MMKILLVTLLFGQYLCFPRHEEKERYNYKEEVAEAYTEKYLYQFIDHFNFLGQAGKNGMFKQRYLISG